MKVLIIPTNTLPASPSGPVYVAGALRQTGHEVQIFEHLFAGDLAVALILASRRIVPRKLPDTGYQFRFPKLDDALRHELTVISL
jgi:hypothetical protein